MLNLTKESITKGNTLNMTTVQENLEAELLKHGYDRSIVQATGEYMRAQQGGLVTNMPKGRELFIETLSHTDAFITSMVNDALGKNRKPKFYTFLIEPFMALYLKDQANAEFYEYYKPKYENPLSLLSFFFTRELTKSMVVEDRLVTEVSRRIVNSYVMSYNRFDEANEEELVSTIQLVRTYLQSEHNKYFNEWSAANGIHIGITEQFSSLFISKEDLLETVKDDKSPYKPMLVKPLPHKNLLDTDGGYLTIQSPILKNGESDIIRQVGFTANGRGASWFNDINKLQDTAWAINNDFLSWMKACTHPSVSKYFNTNVNEMQIETNKKVAKIEYKVRKLNASMNDTRFSLNTTSNNELKLALARELQNAIDEIDLLEMEALELKSAVGKARGWEDTITDAEFYKEFDCFYHPLFCDNRGRVYTYNTSLSFQGHQLSKAIIQQYKTEAITEDGVNALKELLGGMVDGYSKKKKEVRIELVNSLESDIEKCINHEDYSIIDTLDEDEVLMALSIMLVLTKRKNNPEYKTGILSYIDSTSSAIQVQALAQRCHKAATLTNLVKTEGDDLPDAYKAVALNCKELCEDIVNQSNDELYANMIVFLMENKPEQVEFTGININQ